MSPTHPLGTRVVMTHPYRAPPRRPDIHLRERRAGLQVRPGACRETIEVRVERVSINGTPARCEPGGPPLFRERIGSAAYDMSFAPPARRAADDVRVAVRHNAADSRAHGTVPFSAITGRVVWKY